MRWVSVNTGAYAQYNLSYQGIYEIHPRTRNAKEKV